MSSAISTEQAPAATTWRSWHLFVILAFLGATAAVLIARDTTSENLVLVSLAVLAAGAAGMAFHRMLAPLVPGSGFELTPIHSARARAALEREKQLVLRSIKELEFDRAMGKVADVDFSDMVARLRTRAIGLMKQLDEEHPGYRALIERELHERLGSAPVARTSGGPKASTRVVCSQCSTPNEHDATFCKSCGQRLAATANA